MIELEQVPDSNIIMLTAKGEVTGDDYESTLVPAIEAGLEQYDKLRLLYVLGEEYEGFDREAMWDDTRVGMSHLRSFEKIGVVSDQKWLRGSIKAFGFLMPGEVKLFHNSELAEAKQWIMEG